MRHVNSLAKDNSLSLAVSCSDFVSPQGLMRRTMVLFRPFYHCHSRQHRDRYQVRLNPLVLVGLISASTYITNSTVRPDFLASHSLISAVGSIGGIVGAAISGSFLFLIACVNIFYLVQAIKERRQMQRAHALGVPAEANDPTKIHGGGCLVRIIAPILRSVDRPWKMYPVGVLFGFGEYIRLSQCMITQDRLRHG